MAMVEALWTKDKHAIGEEIARILRTDLHETLIAVYGDEANIPNGEADRLQAMLLGRFDEAYVADCRTRMERYAQSGAGQADYMCDLLNLETGLMEHLERRTSYYLGLQQQQAEVFLLAFNCDAQLMMQAFHQPAERKQTASREALLNRLSSAIGDVVIHARDGNLSASA